MWKLSIEDDQGNKTVVNLVRDNYAVGRAEDNTIRLTERNISRHHATLHRNSSGWLLDDTNSYNGCFVNGARVGEAHKLEHGDLLQFGDYRLTMLDEAQVAQEPATSRAATVPNVPRSQGLVGQPDRLVMLVGPTPGSEYPLVNERLVIGRGEECDVAVNHSSVSRVHAEIVAVGNGRYEIIDRDSANGVRINGVELQRSLIDARDAIELGDVVFKFIPAGQIYRPGADESQQIGALSIASERMTPAPGIEAQPFGGGLPLGVKLVAGAVGLGLAVLLGVITFGSVGGNKADAEPAASQTDQTTGIIAEARALLEKGDIEAAHQKLAELPADSNARQTGAFRQIEAAWADMLFEKAEATSDPAQKRSLLDRIAKSTSVDSARRKRAANAIAALDGDGVDISELPEGQTPPGDAQQGAKKPAGPRLPGGLVRRNPFDSPKPAPAPQPAPAPKPTSDTVGQATSGDRSQATRAKNQLKAKAAAGTATEQDLRLLRALCRQLGDSSCMN